MAHRKKICKQITRLQTIDWAVLFLVGADEPNELQRVYAMATAKQQSIRLTVEDVAIVEVIQARTGLIGLSDALRFALRQYAIREGIDLRPKSSKKR